METQQVLRDFALELLDPVVSVGTFHTSLFSDCSCIVIESFSRSIDSNMAEKESVIVVDKTPYFSCKNVIFARKIGSFSHFIPKTT